MQSRKTKILVLLNRVSRDTGGMSSSLDLVEALYLLGYDVSIGSSSSSLRYKLWETKRCQTIVPFGRIVTTPKSVERVIGKPSGAPLTTIALLRAIRSALESVVMTLNGSVARFSRLLSSADLVFVAAALTGKGFAAVRRNTKALIVGNHAGSPKAFEDYWLTDEFLLEAASSKSSRYTAYCRRYDALMFQAMDQANECVAHDPAFMPRCYVVPPTCQEHSVLAAMQSQSPYRARRQSVVCVGSVHPRKAQHLAIEAFAMIAEKIPGADLHFVGRGANTQYAAGLLEAVDRASLSGRVFFHGHRTDYLRYIAHATVVVQTSDTEGVSRVLREAMLMKRPIVSFAISGTSTLLESGKEALLVRPNDTAAVAEAIARCLEDPLVAQSLGNSAHRRYLLHNSWAAYASGLREVVECLISPQLHGLGVNVE